ncbi:hypothetical protein BZG36_01997 [Bifiguratus adelaidae]|uniref:Uncharacterized protein n=1 Tax=Bifiguratus adelaidae TaxID=1938954 RepID=A0A261Y443_9FUNG|nr:hypothetical protein BZG36_01997 [Bifiguratus adelaidae]
MHRLYGAHTINNMKISVLLTIVALAGSVSAWDKFKQSCSKGVCALEDCQIDSIKCSELENGIDKVMKDMCKLQVEQKNFAHRKYYTKELELCDACNKDRNCYDDDIEEFEKDLFELQKLIIKQINYINSCRPDFTVYDPLHDGPVGYYAKYFS